MHCRCALTCVRHMATVCVLVSVSHTAGSITCCFSGICSVLDSPYGKGDCCCRVARVGHCHCTLLTLLTEKGDCCRCCPEVAIVTVLCWLLTRKGDYCGPSWPLSLYCVDSSQKKETIVARVGYCHCTLLTLLTERGDYCCPSRPLSLYSVDFPHRKRRLLLDAAPRWPLSLYRFLLTGLTDCHCIDLYWLALQIVIV